VCYIMCCVLKQDSNRGRGFYSVVYSNGRELKRGCCTVLFTEAGERYCCGDIQCFVLKKDRKRACVIYNLVN